MWARKWRRKAFVLTSDGRFLTYRLIPFHFVFSPTGHHADRSIYLERRSSSRRHKVHNRFHNILAVMVFLVVLESLSLAY